VLASAFGNATHAARIFVERIFVERIFVERVLLPGRSARERGFVDVPFHVVSVTESDQVETLSFRPEGVTLKLDAESIEYILDRLERSTEDGFYPAEMCEVVVDAKGEGVTLYSEYKQELSLPSDC